MITLKDIIELNAPRDCRLPETVFDTLEEALQPDCRFSARDRLFNTLIFLTPHGVQVTFVRGDK